MCIRDRAKSIQTDVQKPILQSYLDVVFQGYLDHFGEDGIASFIATTLDWDRPILNDRDAPLYPRAQNLSLRELKIIDHFCTQIPK